MYHIKPDYIPTLQIPALVDFGLGLLLVDKEPLINYTDLVTKETKLVSELKPLLIKNIGAKFDSDPEKNTGTPREFVLHSVVDFFHLMWVSGVNKNTIISLATTLHQQVNQVDRPTTSGQRIALCSYLEKMCSLMQRYVVISEEETELKIIASLNGKHNKLGVDLTTRINNSSDVLKKQMVILNALLSCIPSDFNTAIQHNPLDRSKLTNELVVKVDKTLLYSYL